MICLLLPLYSKGSCCPRLSRKPSKQINYFQQGRKKKKNKKGADPGLWEQGANCYKSAKINGENPQQQQQSIHPCCVPKGAAARQ